MTAGLTLAGGSAVARNAVVYRPTTELVVQPLPPPNRGGGGGGGGVRGVADNGGANRTSTTIPWSQRQKQATASGKESPPPPQQQQQQQQQPQQPQLLSGTGSAHSTFSSPTRVRRTAAQPASAIPIASSPSKASAAGTKLPAAAGEQLRRTSSSSSQPPVDRRLVSPPRRRLVPAPRTDGMGVSAPSSPEKAVRIRNVAPRVARTSPVKQRPPPSAILDATDCDNDDEDVTSVGSHCMVGVPKKTSQSLRLVRILLNQPTLKTVTKLYVNQAIQRHMHTLKDLQSTRQAKQILETQLEIAKTESDISKAAAAAAEERLKSVKWKLAKERQATKDKLEAAAATIAMSSSIAPAAASTANLTDIVALVEKTVVSLRAKEKVLRELNGTAGNDEARAMVEQLELESKLLRQHLDPEGCSEGGDSDSTPIMGHQSFNSLDLREDVAADHNNSWSKEKRELKREFEETVASAERKIDQLKSVLTVCNERRVRAEQFLTESQKEELIQFTIENQEQLAHNTSMAKSTHGDGLIKVESVDIVDHVDDDLESSQLALDVTETGKIQENGDLKQLIALKEKLQALETQTDLLTREKEALAAMLHSSRAEKELQESKAAELEKSLLETERKVFDILKIGTEQALDEAKVRTETIGEELARATAELTCSKKRVLELESELESTRQTLKHNSESMETAMRQQTAIENELQETKKLLNKVRTELEILKALKQPRQSVIDSRSAVRQAEAKYGEIRARLSHGVRPYHSAHGPSKIRSRITAFERLSNASNASNASSSDHNAKSHHNDDDDDDDDDDAAFKRVHSFRSQSTTVDCEMPTQDEMDADTEKITTIQLAFASSQCNVDSLRSADSSHEASVVHSHEPEENAVDMDCEIADLKRRLADKSRRLIEAEKKLVAFNTETKRDDTVEDAHETLRQTLDEMKDLKQKVISSTEELNEAQGKLIFLRKVVLSVVPWEEDDEHDDTNCGEAEAKC